MRARSRTYIMVEIVEGRLMHARFDRRTGEYLGSTQAPVKAKAAAYKLRRAAKQVRRRRA